VRLALRTRFVLMNMAAAFHAKLVYATTETADVVPTSGNSRNAKRPPIVNNG
jgi:hypothetical protein